MLSPDEVRTGFTSIPGFVDRYGVVGGLHRWAGIVYNRLTRTITGRSIFERDWDVCILLDACRADELARQRRTFEWIGEVDRYPSLASCTWNWMPRTFAATPASVLKDTIYVCSNPFSADFCSTEQFYELDEVWKYAWDDRKGTVYPRPVTDRAIHQWRTKTASRMLVHYLQPHVPFLSDNADSLSRNNFDHDVESVPDAWDRVTRGELSRQTAIAQYRETLQCVLEDIELLLSNIDAERVVITADHGECFGDWGLYGHTNEIDLPCLTSVPWVETSGTDRGTHTPGTYETAENTVERTDQLRALGYVARTETPRTMTDHTNGPTDAGVHTGDDGYSRRDYLTLASTSVVVVGGLVLMTISDELVTEGGPPPLSNWSLVFDDRFDENALDTDHWSIGWGWGKNTTTSNTHIVPENVVVTDGTLRLRGTHDGTDVLSGAVNTKNTVTFGPGSYVEAKVRFAGRRGFLNAVWSKPNSEKWPPEIDVVELWENGSGRDDRYRSRHHLHYSHSTIPGDNSTERDIGTAYTPGDDLTKNFHIYGVEWQTDHISYYVDEVNVARFTDETMLTAMQRGRPFYLMASLNINNIGTADITEPWGEEMILDWVRVWKSTPTH